MQSDEPDTVIRRHKGGVRKCRVRKDGWTDDQRNTFIETLSETSNLTASAREAGKHIRGAYRLREQNADFRKRWDAALSEGYAQLELAMLHRARFGSQTTTTVIAEGVPVCERVTHSFGDAVGIRLLNHHCTSMSIQRAVAAIIEPADPDAEDTETDRGIAALRALLSRGGAFRRDPDA